MTAGELRHALAAAYDMEADTGVWMARSGPVFEYADGGEAQVGAAIRGASDVATGSPELARAIGDWATQYHLSPARANVLRPLARRIGNSVLEIGAGCGAITRFLGESGALVLALEGNAARARIAAARCRGLDNVVVVCDRFDRLALPGARFDLVTLVGVLEYSRVYMAGDDPVQAMLGLARERVAPRGRLAIAIENQLGGKYLAGIAEDHLGAPWVGVMDGYGRATPVTFGRRELERRVHAAGFKSVEMLYPFPDYKLAAAIVTEAGFAHPGFNAADLAATAHAQRLDEGDPPAFSEALARDVFVRNGLGSDTANSFLCLAGDVPAETRDVLAYAYSVARDRPYAGEARFVAEGTAIVVQRRAQYSANPDAKAPVGLVREERERYIPGEVLYRGLQRIVARPGWSVEAIAEWAAPWVALLKARAQAGVLPGDLFDCTPFNVIRDASGELHAFDLEWRVAGAAPSIEHVVFRGLYNGLLRLDFAAAPAPGLPTDIAWLASLVMEKLGVPADRDRILDWMGRDYALTGVIAGTPRASAMPHPPALRIGGEVVATAGELDALRALLQSSESERAGAADRVARLAERQRELDSILARPHHRLASWLGDLVEPFPKLRALARAPFEALAGRPRVGAIVHLYYEDLWPEMRAFIARIPSLERLYVSIGEHAARETEAAIARDFPGARVRRFPNRGRDVLPFLEFLDEAGRDGIELVCKVHGKRSPHVATGDAWRRDMLEKVLGSEATVRAIVERFRADPALGIVGPGGHVVPASFYWKRNAEKVAELCDRLGLDVSGVEFRYVAGSMFWARVKALAPLLRLMLRAEDFEPEPAPADGTLAHALERLFPLAARISGLRLDETENPGGTTVRDFAP